MRSYVHSSSIHNNQDMETPKCPSTNEWIKKMWYIYIHSYIHTHTLSGILLSHQQEWNNAICSNVDRIGDYHTKWSKPERKDKYHMISHIWNLKYNTNELVYEIETHSQT